MIRRPPRSPLFPSPPLFRSLVRGLDPRPGAWTALQDAEIKLYTPKDMEPPFPDTGAPAPGEILRSEEHTSELQSRLHLVCRLLLEKKNNASRGTHARVRDCR